MSARREQERIDFYLGFGARFREARLARGLTEREAADAIGITVRRLRRLEIWAAISRQLQQLQRSGDACEAV